MADTRLHGIVEIRCSAIEGTGLFALQPFDTGEVIRTVNVVREVTAGAPLRPDKGERADHCDYCDGKVFLIGPPDRHINHSCNPNAWARYIGAEAQIVARHAIAANEEITLDYSINLTGGDSWPCQCGADRCRGVVTGDYFALPLQVQREYAPYLADWFVRRHAARLRAAHVIERL